MRIIRCSVALLMMSVPLSAAEGESRLEQVNPINPYEADLSDASRDRTPAEHIRIARHHVSRSEFKKASVSIEKAAEKLKIEAERATPENAVRYQDAARFADQLGDKLAEGRIKNLEPVDKLAAQVRDIAADR